MTERCATESGPDHGTTTELPRRSPRSWFIGRRPVGTYILARDVSAALLVCSLLFGNMVGRLSDPSYRLFVHADSTFRTALVLDVVLLAAAAVGVGALLRRSGCARLYR